MTVAEKKTLCMNPGPIAFEKDVLDAFAHEGISHVDPYFIDVFGNTLENLRKVFLAQDGQPLVVTGSGTLGWDMVASNLLEADDNVLVINTGYFGDHFGDCFSQYGANVTYLRAPVGERPSVAELSKALSTTQFKAVTITHVDTSTGVLANVAEYTAAVRAAQPDALVIVDSVCALGGEELRMKAWDVDVVLTGSQKCLGVPAGLSILVIRPRALKVHEKLSATKPKYYCDWTNWLGIMKNYEARRPSYFATPAVNHVFALHKSLEILLANGGMEARFREHRAVSAAIKAAIQSWGIDFVPVDGVAANTMTCVRFPKGISGPDLLPKVYARGVSLAGGLHKEIKTEYFRIGHMGPSTRRADHAAQTVAAIEAALIECGFAIAMPGQAVQKLKATLTANNIPLTPASGVSTLKSTNCGCMVPLKCQFLTLGVVVLSFGVGFLLSNRRR
ncbi:hypothetical protein H310_04483 [Aphanomyces invadans]|uniref:alanine--glyoxylate transaminase n=1 Tax=Aphanomyces invadans TaxID=157072 RepID=A0A024UER2_9STRA|nr:hypothetical protein H310_04483 [Aphanomyces invadans]ETW04123.1 hypothetical protein H310_04483 [Aphanomyces invadans]|eukprot:XP_008867079.1 hypothetical protein H310_04483 [Aphanomyces invadans]